MWPRFGEMFAKTCFYFRRSLLDILERFLTRRLRKTEEVVARVIEGESVLLLLGDGTQSSNAAADVTAFAFNQVPEPPAALLAGLRLASIFSPSLPSLRTWQRRLCAGKLSFVVKGGTAWSQCGCV